MQRGCDSRKKQVRNNSNKPGGVVAPTYNPGPLEAGAGKDQVFTGHFQLPAEFEDNLRYTGPCLRRKRKTEMGEAGEKSKEKGKLPIAIFGSGTEMG